MSGERGLMGDVQGESEQTTGSDRDCSPRSRTYSTFNTSPPPPIFCAATAFSMISTSRFLVSAAIATTTSES